LTFDFPLERPTISLTQHRLYASDVAAYLPRSTGILQLAVCSLKAQVEALSAKSIELLG
jgi:hypothetical protein